MHLMVSYFVLSYSHEMSWMRSGTKLSQFLRIFLPFLNAQVFINDRCIVFYVHGKHLRSCRDGQLT